MAVTVENFQNEIGWALSSNSDRFVFDKPSVGSQVANGYCSLWRQTGVPGQAAIPAAAALCTKATTGAIGFTNQVAPMTSYFAYAYYIASVAGQAVEIHDRIGQMGGLSGALATAQNVLLDAVTLNPGADRLGAADYSDILWWMEWYVLTGTTGVTATVNVTYNDATTGNIAVTIPANMNVARMIPIISAVADKFIRGVNTITLSGTTGTVGSFGVTCTRQRSALENDVGGKGKVFYWAMLGASEIPNNSCLTFILPCISTTTGTIKGQGKLAHV